MNYLNLGLGIIIGMCIKDPKFRIVLETSSFLKTTVFPLITYKKVNMYVYLYTLLSKSNEENYKNIIPKTAEENLNNKNILIPLKKMFC